MSHSKLVDTAKSTKSRAPKTALAPKFQNFRVRKVRDPHTGHEQLVVELHKQPLRDLCRSYLNIEGVYDDVPAISADLLWHSVDRLRKAARREKSAPAAELIKLLEQENQQTLVRLKNLADKGMITFSLLSHIFEEGTEIVVLGAHPQGGVVAGCRYRQSMFGNYLEVMFDCLESNGKSINTFRDTVVIKEFSGVRELEQLPARVLNQHWRDVLTARGRKYAQVARGAHYQNYTSHMQVKSWWNWSDIRANGRIMVDISTYNQFCEDAYNSPTDDTNGVGEVQESQLWMCSPWITGFSFASKKWGRFAVSHIEDIEFKDRAFEQLVLDQDKKELIRSLVVDSGSGFQDIISGKGGGCIFLLHGEPGVGKTLTAEAVSEMLHRPLYSVSVGELGVDVESLEKNLRRILDVAQVWNAVILIDEADIFLEKRGHDIVRSSMTSVMLRLLEYHQGVLFLTTNRVKEFDPAFYSRISIALRYGSLTDEARTQIWTNLLDAANVSGLNAQELGKVPLNGRQIKTIIRLAQGLARQQGVAVSMQHINQTVEIGRQFLEDIQD